MIALLQIILGVSFLGIVFVVGKENLQNPQTKKTIAYDIQRLLRIIKSSKKIAVFRQTQPLLSSLKGTAASFSNRMKRASIMKTPQANISQTSELEENFFDDHKEKKSFFKADTASQKKEPKIADKLKHFFLPKAKTLLPRFIKGGELFFIDMKRASSQGLHKSKEAFISSGKGVKKGVAFVLPKALTLGKYTFSKSKGALRALKEDLKTFELPSHKEDFFDRLQEDSSRDSLSEPTLQEQEKAGSISSKKMAPGFQEKEILSPLHDSDVDIDANVLAQKEQNLIEAIRKNPKNPNFYKRLGKIYLQMQNFPDAKNCFEHAVKLGAQDPELNQLIGGMNQSG